MQPVQPSLLLLEDPQRPALILVDLPLEAVAAAIEMLATLITKAVIPTTSREGHGE